MIPCGRHKQSKKAIILSRLKSPYCVVVCALLCVCSCVSVCGEGASGEGGGGGESGDELHVCV